MFERSIVAHLSVVVVVFLATFNARAQKIDDLFKEPLPASNAQHWKDFEAQIERFQPASVRGKGDAPNGYLLLRALGERIEARQRAQADAGEAARPFDFDAIAQPSPDTAGDVEHARRGLADYERLGFFAAIDEIGRAERVARAPSEGALVAMLLPELAHARGLTRALAARFEISLAEGRPLDAMRDFDRMLVLARVPSFGASIIERLVSNAIALRAMDHLRGAILAGKLGSEELKLAAESMALRLGDRPPSALAIEGERLMARDSIDIVYSSSNGVPQDVPNLRRFAVVQAMSAPSQDGVNAEGAPGLASAKEVRELAERVYDQMARAAASPRSQRVDENAPPLKDDLRGREIVLQVLLPAIDRFLAAQDRFATDLAATQAMIALERFRARTGSYPEKLSELTPADLAATPIDAWSGEPLRYRREGEAYRLYSTGFDGKDDGGTTDPKDASRACSPDGQGLDAVYR